MLDAVVEESIGKAKVLLLSFSCETSEEEKMG
jgi:hypothetical protein